MAKVKITVEHSNGDLYVYDGDKVFWKIFEREDTGQLEVPKAKWNKLVKDNAQEWDDQVTEVFHNILND